MSSSAALRDPPSPLLVGTVVWLTSEVLFFGSLFGAWFSLRSSNPDAWPPDGAEVGVLLPAVGTALLLASSATVQRAAHATGRGHARDARRWLLVTIACGLVFLSLQAREWAELSFSVDDHALATAFYALTGFHGLHVAGGLLAMMAMLWRVGEGPAAHEPVEVVSYYWHLVDVVWLALFASVYLST